MDRLNVDKQSINELVENHFRENVNDIFLNSRFKNYRVTTEEIEPGVLAIQPSQKMGDSLDFMKNYRIGTLCLSYFGTITENREFKATSLIGTDTGSK